jgi:hypothetical protein
VRTALTGASLRWLVRATAITVALGLLLAASAWAGSDLYSNVGPGSSGVGGLAERYPLGNYALDQHFDAVKASITGGVDVSGVPPMIAYFLANSLWQITAFVANALITVFTFAFSLDLLNGSEATGGAGALGPVSDAMRTIYQDVFGEPWLVVAVVLTGMWAIWRGLVQRRYTETAGSLGLSVVFVVIALAFVTQPERTIGQASQWTNRMSVAFLSLGHAGGQEQAKRAASDQLFALLVYDPWTVLEFGGIEHCAKDGTGSTDADPDSVAVRPLSPDPARDRELRRQLASGTQVHTDAKTCINNRTTYAPRFLRYPPGSEDRDQEYEALNHADSGQLPGSDPAKDTGAYQLGVADKPVTDAMEQHGQYQRLLIAIVAFLAELGAFLLLGALSVAVILAQILVVLLLAFAPVALVVGVLPGRGHDFFRGWLTRLAGFLLRKAVYSLVLAVLLAVCAAVASATAMLGWLLSFALQAGFFWTVFLWRHQLADSLLNATTATGASRHEGLGRLASTYYAVQLVGRPTRHLRRLGGNAGRRTAGATAAGSAAGSAKPHPSDRQPDDTRRSATRTGASTTRAAGERTEQKPSKSSRGRRNKPKQSTRAQRSTRRASQPRGQPAAKAPRPNSTAHARASSTRRDTRPAGAPPAGGRAQSHESTNPLAADLRADHQRLADKRTATPAAQRSDQTKGAAVPHPAPGARRKLRRKGSR